MQQDLVQHQQLLSVKLWQHYSRGADPAHPIKTASIVAYAPARDGYSFDEIRQILLHDPALVKIRQRSGDAAVQNHLKIALRFAEYQMRLHQQPQQIYKQTCQQKPELQL